MDININIELLVLNGISLEHRHQIEVNNAVIAELSRALLSMPDNTHPNKIGSHSHIFGSQIIIDGNIEPTSIGSKIGRAICRSLAK